jgi:hypothetical protein
MSSEQRRRPRINSAWNRDRHDRASGYSVARSGVSNFYPVRIGGTRFLDARRRPSPRRGRWLPFLARETAHLQSPR